jgi:hypothetical protein
MRSGADVAVAAAIDRASARTSRGAGGPAIVKTRRPRAERRERPQTARSPHHLNADGLV